MKKTITIFLRLSFLLGAMAWFSGNAHATHLMGYDLTYICIPDSNASLCDPGTASCKYRISLNVYFDCEGGATVGPFPNPPGIGTIRFQTNQPGSSCADPTAITPFTNVSYVEVTPVCATEITGCRTNPFGGQRPINGTMEGRWTGDWDFCAVNCSTYRMEWSSCCRNSVITSGANDDGMYTGNTTIDLGIVPCNSSPQFATVPVPYICSGQNFTFSQGAYDPDGDSLVFSLSPCFQGNNNPVGYNAGFSPATPLGPSWGVTVNPRTGDVSLTANPGSPVIAVICVTVEEYRDGIKLGEVSRDIQVFVVNCGPNNLPSITGLANPVDASITGNLQVSMCAGKEASFDVLVSDPDLLDSLFVRSPNLTVIDPTNGRITQNGATVTVARGTGANPPVARVTFNPLFAGNYFIIMEVTDDNCPLLGTNQLAIEVNAEFCGLVPVTSAARTTNANTGSGAPVDCYTVEFLIEPNSCNIGYYYDIDPGDNSPIYNDTTEGETKIFHTYPQTSGTVTYTYTFTVVDSAGFRFDTTSTITIVNNAVANAGPDVTLCPNVPGQIGVPGQVGYNYRWSVCNNPGNPGLPAPPANQSSIVTVQLDNQRNTPIVVPYCLTAIDSFGCPAIDQVDVTFAPKPRPDFVINNNFPEACEGEQASFQYVGLRPAGISYIWDFSSTANGPNNPLGPGPHFASWPTQGFPTVSLQTVVRGCTSDVVTRPIEIKPIPTASFSATPQVCANESAVLTFNGVAGPTASGIWDFGGGTVTRGDPNGLDPISVSWSTPGMKIITLIVDDRDCLSPLYRDTVIVNKIPTPDFNTLSPVCQNDSMRITYTGNASPSASYIWEFDGATTSPLINGFQGPYNANWDRAGSKTVCLQVQELGCFSAKQCDTISVLPAPEAEITPVSDLCFNSGQHAVVLGYTGTPNPDTYEWIFGPTASIPFSNSANPPALTYSAPGEKTVQLIVSKDGCVSDTATISFRVLRDPEADFIIQAATGSVCAGDTVTFQRTGRRVSNTETYSWNFGVNAVPATSNQLDPGPVVYTSGGSKVVTLVVRHGPGCEDRYAAQLRVEDRPDFTAGPDLRYCEGTGGIQINATTTGGIPNYTWNWTCDRGVNCGLSNNSVEDPMVNPTGVGPDTIVFNGYAVDSRGCKSNVDPVKVIIDPKPIVDAGPDLVLCDGGPGDNLEGGLHPTNRAAGPFSWEWRDDAGNVPPLGMTNYQQPIVYTRPPVTTIYTLVVTDISTGCTSEVTTVDTNSTVTVMVLPRPIANAGPDTVVCFDDQIQLRGSGIGGEGNYTYQWSPDNPLVGFMDDPTLAEPTVGPFQTTTYTLVVSASGCVSDADEVEVIVHTVPTVDAGDDKVVCFSDSVILDGSATGAPQNGVGYTYIWTPAIGLSDPRTATPNASPGTDQVYQLEVRSDYGCGSDVDEVLVTVEPIPFTTVLNRDTILCEGDELTLIGTHVIGGAAPANPNVIYEWTPGSQVSGDNTNPVVRAKPTETTNYVLTTTLGACSTSDDVLVSVAPGVDAEIVVSDTVICAGETITLEALGGLGNSTYTWAPALGVADPNAPTTTATPPTSVTYRLTLEEGVCDDVEEVTIKVNPTPVADYFASETSGCEGLQVSFLENATDGIAYVWDFGDGTPISNNANPVHTFTSAGSFPVTLTVIGEGGCENSITKEIVEISDGSFASFTSTPTIDDILYLPNAEVSFLNQSENGVSYLWDFGDGNYSSQENPVHTFTEPGQYSVTLSVTDSRGCISTAVVGLYDVQVPGLRIPNIFTPNGDGFNDFFFVQYEGSEPYQIEVFDRWGRKYFIADSPLQVWRGTNKNGDAAPEGVYYYTITIGETAYTGNVTLMR